MGCTNAHQQDPSGIQEKLYNLVVRDQSAKLDIYLRKNKHASAYLTELYERDEERLSLLMLAALHGHHGVVRVILSHSTRVVELIELKGNVLSKNNELVEDVTALWCALDRGHFKLAKTLIDFSKTDVTQDRFAQVLIESTRQGRLDAIQFLVENRYADINRAVANDHQQSTSLVIAICRRYTNIVAYLISRGANVDYKTQINENTPLIWAIKFRNLDSMELLCKAGASVNIENSIGKTPLILAAEQEFQEGIELLLDHKINDISIGDLELVASSCIIFNRADQQQKIDCALRLLRQCLQKRQQCNIPKVISLPIAAYDFHQECQSIDELNQIANSPNRLYIEALLIQERILRPKRTEKMFKPLLDRVIMLVENNKFDSSLQLSRHKFHLYQEMELYTSLHRFVWIFCRMLTNQIPITREHFLPVCQLLFEPSQKNTQDENTIANAIFLLTISAKVLEQPILNEDDRILIVQWIRNLCREKGINKNGKTLLHMCVDPQTAEGIVYRRLEIRPILIFPNLSSVKLLIQYGTGIDLDAMDHENNDTALHTIVRHIREGYYADNLDIVKLLVNQGAHLDCVNKNRKTPIEETKEIDVITYLQSKMIPRQLKCLCAHRIITENLPYDRFLSEETKLHRFLQLHDGAKLKSYKYEDIIVLEKDSHKM